MSPRPLRVLVVNWLWAPEIAAPEQLLETYSDLPALAASLASAGAEVTVLQRFGSEADWTADGVRWRFAVDGPAGQPRTRMKLRRFHRLAAELAGDAVHATGVKFYRQLADLRRALPPQAVLLAQDHASRPPQGWRRWIAARALGRLDGIAFAGEGLAERWHDTGVLPRQVKVYEIMEGSCSFRRLPREVARAQTGLAGEPAFLWIGRLVPLKDPLTMIEGLLPILRQRSQARLYLVYQDAELLPEIQRRLAAEPAVAERVHLLGKQPRDAIEALASSCHYFVAASHIEGSGYALAEALACGLVPIVTDLPSFRMMTSQGRVGTLFEVGNPASLTAAAERVLAGDHAELSAVARRQFEEHLSWDAIGRDLVAAYRDAIARRSAA